MACPHREWDRQPKAEAGTRLDRGYSLCLPSSRMSALLTTCCLGDPRIQVRRDGGGRAWRAVGRTLQSRPAGAILLVDWEISGMLREWTTTSRDAHAIHG